MQDKIYKYGPKSLAVLETLHPDLQKVCRFLIQYWNVSLFYGWRGEEVQNELFERGDSDLPWPRSKHNFVDANGKPLSKAVDLAIWHPEKPHIHWDDREGQVHFSGIVLGVGYALGVPLRAGCDWNENIIIKDNWCDAWHIEMKK